MLLESSERVAVVIRSLPEIVTFAMNGEEGLIEALYVSRFGAPAARLISIRLPEPSTPRAHAFKCQ
jgi:hypothetical protein